MSIGKELKGFIKWLKQFEEHSNMLEIITSLETSILQNKRLKILTVRAALDKIQSDQLKQIVFKEWKALIGKLRLKQLLVH